MTGKFVFSANDGATGDELWITDGTEAGTILLKDIFPQTSPNVYAGSNPHEFVHLGDGNVLFIAHDGANEGIYVTDGTAVGTTLVQRFGSNNGIRDLTVMSDGQHVLFGADDGVHGNELWMTDGTASGTHMVKDIVPGTNPSSPSGITDIGNGKFLFRAISPVGQTWVTDGTTAGTQAISAGVSYQGAGGILLANGKLLFFGNTASGVTLFVTNGTAEGTLQLSSGLSTQGPLVSLGNGYVVFNGTAFDGTNITKPRELWITNGTPEGTHMLKDINPTPDGNFGDRIGWSDPHNFKSLGNGQAIFSASSGDAQGQELWITDGTEDGTHLVKDLNPGFVGSNPSYSPEVA